jgi:exopolysaccharide biosynthesis polyprenyl glycosylphosphotransferase
MRGAEHVRGGLAPAVAPDPDYTSPLAVASAARRVSSDQQAPRSETTGRVRWVVAGDLLAIYASIAVTYVAAHMIAPPAVVGPTGWAAAIAVAMGPAWLAIFAAYRLYERQIRGFSPPGLDELSNLFHALLAGSLVFSLGAQALKRFTDLSLYTALEAFIFLVVALVAVPVVRASVRAWLLPAIARPRRTLIIGAGPVGQLVADRVRSHPEYGLELVGFVDDEAVEGSEELAGSVQDLPRLVEELDVDWVIVAFSRVPYEQMHELVRSVRRPDVHLSIVPRYFELFASNATIEDVQGMPIVSLPPMRLSRMVHAVKRATDIVGAGLGLLVLAPLFLLVAIAIKLDSRGPVFFRQLRRGRAGSTFSIVKFRTMCADAEQKRFELGDLNEVNGPLFKIARDPRITRVGGFLRRTSLDELPQLWNVLRGDMSLVGPRPFVVHEADQIVGWAGRRLDITPGVTGPWQVMGRNDLSFEEMTTLDYVYVTNWSLWWDFKILIKTIPAVLAKRGAY